jgi:hypothetical protein
MSKRRSGLFNAKRAYTYNDGVITNIIVLPTVVTVSAPGSFGGSVLATGTVSNAGSSPLLARGFVWSGANPTPTLADNVSVDAGTNIGTFTYSVPMTGSFWIAAYATNSGGTTYGEPISTYDNPCLAKGTLITMYDRTVKTIEDITYDDVLLVWDFDNGMFSSSLPLWIKKVQTATKYNLLEFSNGSTLKTIVQHRIFNKEQGKFTWPMSEDTPVGTHTFTDSGNETILVNKSVIDEDVDFYNIITDYHINLFANGILTSSKYNNIYPIVDMNFVKDQICDIHWYLYHVPEKWYYGLRLSEQSVIPVTDTNEYVIQRLRLDKNVKNTV